MANTDKKSDTITFKKKDFYTYSGAAVLGAIVVFVFASKFIREHDHQKILNELKGSSRAETRTGQLIDIKTNKVILTKKENVLVIPVESFKAAFGIPVEQELQPEPAKPAPATPFKTM